MSDLLFREWVQSQVAKESYWFHRIELFRDLATPGWSDPRTDKLPYFGLPQDLTGQRVLDIGCAEGFFSFEAERRGAKEVVAIDSFPDSVRRFNICRNALGSKTTAFLCNVYDLNPRGFGTFDIVFFFGVLYICETRFLHSKTFWLYAQERCSCKRPTWRSRPRAMLRSRVSTRSVCRTAPRKSRSSIRLCSGCPMLHAPERW